MKNTLDQSLEDFLVSFHSLPHLQISGIGNEAHDETAIRQNDAVKVVLRWNAVGRPWLSTVASPRPGMRLNRAPQIHNTHRRRLRSLLVFVVKLCHLIVQRTQYPARTLPPLSGGHGITGPFLRCRTQGRQAEETATEHRQTDKTRTQALPQNFHAGVVQGMSSSMHVAGSRPRAVVCCGPPPLARTGELLPPAKSVCCVTGCHQSSGGIAAAKHHRQTRQRQVTASRGSPAPPSAAATSTPPQPWDVAPAPCPSTFPSGL